MKENLSPNLQPGNEVTLKQVISKLNDNRKYLSGKWKLIFIVGILGAVLGLVYSFIRKPVYIAITSFVLDDGDKGGGLSQYAGLAALAGINMSNSGGGLFQGENILQLYTSRTMIEKTLLAKKRFENSDDLLINRYITFNDLRDKWKDKPQLASIDFKGDPTKFNRLQDSVITDIYTKINAKNLFVANPDKKSSIIMVEVDAKDELFAKVFAQTLVENVNNFYVQTKTKKAADNLEVLRRQADSVKRILNSSLAGVAASIDAEPNANPYQLSLKVPSQRKQVDVSANAAIYAEVVKNMEIAKMSLLQSKPLIQIIDEPVLPLTKDKVGKIKGIVVGGLLASFLIVIWLLLVRFFRSALDK